MRMRKRMRMRTRRMRMRMRMRMSPKYAHNGHMGIWAYVKKYGQVGYPLRKHQKCNSETLTSGPQDPPFKSYGQQLFLQGKCLVFYIVTKKKFGHRFLDQIEAQFKRQNGPKYSGDQESRRFQPFRTTCAKVSWSNHHHH